MLVVIPTVYGNEIGICQGQTSNMEEIQYQDNLQDIVRIATEKDRSRHAENIKKEDISTWDFFWNTDYKNRSTCKQRFRRT